MVSPCTVAIWFVAIAGSSALRTIHGDEQRPLVIQESEPERQDTAPQATNPVTARLALYPGTRLHPEDAWALGKHIGTCPDDANVKTTELEFDACLSGEYYARSNIKITSLPVCPDGSSPTVSFYRQRECKGEPSITKAGTDIVNTCLWSENEEPNPSYYWSLILQCALSEPPATIQHKTSEAVILNSFHGGLAGSRYFYDWRPCTDDEELRTRAWDQEVDVCGRFLRPSFAPLFPPSFLPLPFFFFFFFHIRFSTNLNVIPANVSVWPYAATTFSHLRLDNAPICPNGTRARLARYEDTGESDLAYARGKCNNFQFTFRDSLVDINDQDIGACINVRKLLLSRGGVGNTKGIAFYCDGPGIDEATRKQNQAQVTKQGVVSHNECAPDTTRWHTPGEPKPARRATTWFEVPVETCVNLRNRENLALRKLPECADGSAPLMAVWPEAGCKGMPPKIGGVMARLGESCRGFYGGDGSASYAFWCDSYGTRRLEAPEGDNRAIYSREECESKDGWARPGRHEGAAAEVFRRDPGSCITGFGSNSAWKIYKNAACPDGKPAKMAFWNDRRCRGKPDSVDEIKEGDLGRCVQACGKKNSRLDSCSRSFWCGA